MDRTTVEDFLAQVERLIANGERDIARHRELVAQLKRDGHRTREAVELLDHFGQLQASLVANRDRLREELGL
jgi:septation ring formation regulator EzrA